MLTLDQWLAIGGLLVGLLGIFAAYVFYAKGRREPEPWYSIHPLKVHIVDKAQVQVQGLEIQHNGVPLSGKNITATTIFWGNRGNAPLRRSDILEPITIKFPNESEILEARIVTVSRHLCDFVIETAQTRPREAQVAFNIVEKYDGVKVQIIHSGNPDVLINVSGIFVGCKLIELDYNTIAQSNWEFRYRFYLYFALAFNSVGMLVYALVNFLATRSHPVNDFYNIIDHIAFNQYYSTVICLIITLPVVMVSFLQIRNSWKAKNSELAFLTPETSSEPHNAQT